MKNARKESTTIDAVLRQLEKTKPLDERLAEVSGGLLDDLIKELPSSVEQPT